MSRAPEYKITRLSYPPHGWPEGQPCWRAVTVIQGHTFSGEGTTTAGAFAAMTRAVHGVTCAFQRAFEALLREGPAE